ncbi:cupredoxin domain-containing protein [Mycobacterium hubeiense]|uniref:cupredoxin domain-containing protein n=1 Tax=Mycobacterium hubeiense TaxID=1867256 RepID=UPI000C7F76CC|nr:cupredoxin domain-containing protein [Mycobacterium sp. QGD 101]
MKRICLSLAGLCLVAAVVTSCGESSTTTEERETGTATLTASPTETTEAEDTPQASGPTITIANMSFGEPITVDPGAQIKIVNDDSAEHSVTSQTEGQFDVHVDGNEEGTLTAPTQPGEYAYHCIYHPNMKGTLIVK